MSPTAASGSMPRPPATLIEAGAASASIGPGYPPLLRQRLGAEAPLRLAALGNAALLEQPKTALFASVRCPGRVILPTYDQAAGWRDESRCIISGFHSPVEMECLRILLRGRSPVIHCPARALPKRIPSDWREALADGRMLLLSAFAPSEKRVTKELTVRRNRLVAALADHVFFAHITPGGRSEDLLRWIRQWQLPYSQADAPTTHLPAKPPA